MPTLFKKIDNGPVHHAQYTTSPSDVLPLVVSTSSIQNITTAGYSQSWPIGVGVGSTIIFGLFVLLCVKRFNGNIFIFFVLFYFTDSKRFDILQ